MSDMKSLSKLKRAGKLRFWRGNIEISEQELHEICNEIQAEYDLVEEAMNKAIGNWAKTDTKLRENRYTRWYELFGTPERTADYFATQCMGGDNHTCETCLLVDCRGTLHTSPHPIIRTVLLEWLKGVDE